MKVGEKGLEISKKKLFEKPKIKTELRSLKHDDFNEKPSVEDIEHYGVLGMKWGIRKNPQKAYDKANKKLSSLDKRATRAGSKAVRKETNSIDKQSRADRALLFKKLKARSADKAIGRSERARQDYVKSMSKAVSWHKEMQKAFQDVPISTLNKEYIDLGKKYSDIKISELMSNAETSYANKQLRMLYRQMSK